MENKKSRNSLFQRLRIISVHHRCTQIIIDKDR
nr:MAG TPA: hypothetical protein [Herelleviridae sp.]